MVRLMLITFYIFLGQNNNNNINHQNNNTNNNIDSIILWIELIRNVVTKKIDKKCFSFFTPKVPTT